MSLQKQNYNISKNTPIHKRKEKTQKTLILQACAEEHYPTLQPAPRPQSDGHSYQAATHQLGVIQAANPPVHAKVVKTHVFLVENAPITNICHMMKNMSRYKILQPVG